VRASRVDYYHQHQIDVWHDQLGSLGLGGEHAVFVNLAAIAGPVTGRPDAMMHVNYKGESESPHAARFASLTPISFIRTEKNASHGPMSALHSRRAGPPVHGSYPPFEAHSALIIKWAHIPFLSVNSVQGKWRGCLHLTALLTRLVPST
jgi:hypothetical protein